MIILPRKGGARLGRLPDPEKMMIPVGSAKKQAKSRSKGLRH
ncbi:MAG TPA: hypothetical protein VJ738_11865 [Steroidobacteraceae bacterium]|nr:hypothetical protein [Steroidobacteraceae bacterium]